MNGDSEKYAHAEIFSQSKSCSNADSIKDRMNENSYPGDYCDVLYVLMWILMTMIMMSVVMMMGCEKFLYDIDEEESSDECI